MKLLYHPWLYVALFFGLVVNVAGPAFHWSDQIMWPLNTGFAIFPFLPGFLPHAKDWTINLSTAVVNEITFVLTSGCSMLQIMAKLLPSAPYQFSWIVPVFITVLISMMTAVANQLTADTSVQQPVTPPAH